MAEITLVHQDDNPGATPDFWYWEFNVLKEEQKYFVNLLDKQEAKINSEVDAAMVGESSVDEKDIRSDIEAKYAKDKQFMLNGLERCMREQEIMFKIMTKKYFIKNHAKYANLKQGRGFKMFDTFEDKMEKFLKEEAKSEQK